MIYYVGGKHLIARHIIPLILKNRNAGEPFVEPFVGGCSVLSKIRGRRIAGDANPFLIALLESVRDGWTPPEQVTEEEYREICLHKEKYSPALVGFVGIACSFGARWFGGYARCRDGRNYAQEASRALRRDSLDLQGVSFFCCDYRALPLPQERCIIYCDPPYAGKTGYSFGGAFDAEAFWQWARLRRREGHDIFISEYSAPPDFACIWQKKYLNSLSCGLSGSRRQSIEKLFTLR